MFHAFTADRPPIKSSDYATAKLKKIQQQLENKDNDIKNNTLNKTIKTRDKTNNDIEMQTF